MPSNPIPRALSSSRLQDLAGQDNGGYGATYQTQSDGSLGLPGQQPAQQQPTVTNPFNSQNGQQQYGQQQYGQQQYGSGYGSGGYNRGAFQVINN